jgi:hypothetical protein
MLNPRAAPVHDGVRWMHEFSVGRSIMDMALEEHGALLVKHWRSTWGNIRVSSRV